ncbi:hypothetical protein LDENG_00092490 [Lucifuga dentata]|nr:hypothetical protein LDENG_00092490 [Lucifuga dentata]
MSRLQSLKVFVNQRLNAAAQEIFGQFERTITEYEEELERQRKLLDMIIKPKLKLQKQASPSDVQQLLVQQEWRPSLDQVEPESSFTHQEDREKHTRERATGKDERSRRDTAAAESRGESGPGRPPAAGG